MTDLPPLPRHLFQATQAEADALVAEAVQDDRFRPLPDLPPGNNALRLILGCWYCQGSLALPRGWVRAVMLAMRAAGLRHPNQQCVRWYRAKLREDRKKELEDALGRLARDEADAEEVMELAKEVELLEEQVASARAAKRANSPIEEKTMTKTHDVQKAAAANREAAERQLDELAKQMQQPGESFHKAYDRALYTDMGKALMRTRDDAQELERGGVTSMELDKARKSLAR